ncbi:MAG: hypothetical protein EOP52_13790 [Sphingobacteriales bacterium]|nr:MAG: hypothetical protein EOP52_13790 [Sphingobacteriales bacterium]
MPVTTNLTATTIFKGDDSGATRLYVTAHATHAFSSPSLAEVIAYRRKNGLPVKADSKAMQFILHNSLIPAPFTPYEDIFALGMGDRLSFNNGQPAYTCEFPYYQNLSTGQSVPSTAKLLELLCQSVKAVAPSGGALMMSSGKDSVSLALALAENGQAGSTEAFTYTDPTQPSDEASDAAVFAKKLGIRHNAISFPNDPAKVREALTHFFTHASHPSCDPTTIPYAVCLYHAGIRDTHIIDGTRNDTYMGIVPSKSYRQLCKYYEYLGGGFSGFKSLRGLVPHYSKAVKFLSTYPEVNLYKHGHFRQTETSRFFPVAINTEAFWRDLYQSHKHLDMVDMRTFIIGQYFDGCSVVLKGATVAESLNSQSVLPWASQPLASYYFNLPEEVRYNRQTLSNKVLVRQMLAEKLDYDASAIGKRIFYFDMQRFVLDNSSFIRDEIINCTLWQSSIGAEVDKYLALTARKARAAGSLIDLFMVSGWHNHSKHLRG